MPPVTSPSNPNPLPQLVDAALTAMLAPSTREPQVPSPQLELSKKEDSLNLWKDWLQIQTLHDPSLEEMVLAAANWAESLKQQHQLPTAQPRWLSLIGGSGNGKTHVARKLFEWARKRFNWTELDYLPRPIYWPQFISDLKSGTRYEERDEIIRWPVLLLDDVFANRDPSGFAADELNTILGCRSNRWTLITANLTLEAIEAIDKRLSSRLIRPPNLFVEVTAPDYATRDLPTKPTPTPPDRRPVHNDL